ncbi:hypothetical protein JRQ81_007730 [Phrynocephalus forsythii]|uniref:Uncharacterized protein n=1 Tax=Phrynocephalus forsythii TaxID=171643 RepID=A0A9Q0XD23_9SAUR|nr:hypothetical protein JRQ81_007730 [Phrynocephalus forsythii]
MGGNSHPVTHNTIYTASERFGLRELLARIDCPAHQMRPTVWVVTVTSQTLTKQSLVHRHSCQLPQHSGWHWETVTVTVTTSGNYTGGCPGGVLPALQKLYLPVFRSVLSILGASSSSKNPFVVVSLLQPLWVGFLPQGSVAD